MLNLKKTAVAVLALGSSAVFAGTMGPVCTPGAVTVPCEMTAWDFGITALYLQPNTTTYNSGHYTDAARRDFRYNNEGNDWDWGFKLEGSYHFSTGNDFTVSWYHFDNEAKDSQITDLDGTTTRFTNHWELEPSWDAVNFEFGQKVNFGERYKIRFHGGAQYVTMENEYEARFGLASHARDFAYKSEFSGFGPRVGADMSWDMANGFSIYANGATALLVGESEFHNRANTDTGVIVTNRSSGERDTVVPMLEGKLGASYSHMMAQGQLTLDAGYMWVDYINAFDASGAFTYDFGFNGPYVGLKWVGNV